MGVSVHSPEAWDLTVAPMSAAVKIDGVTADSDGYYYRAGQLVEITGDEQVGIATTANKAVGILLSSITTKTNPQGLDTRTRVDVHFFGFRKIFRVTAEGTLTAGQRATQGTVNKQRVKAAAPLAATVAVDGSGLTATTTVDAAGLSGSVPAGETPVMSDGAQPTVAITGDVTATTTVTGDVTAATATLAGSILPEVDLGVVWKGATNGNQALLLAY